jgi:hypothetical protein
MTISWAVKLLTPLKQPFPHAAFSAHGELFTLANTKGRSCLLLYLKSSLDKRLHVPGFNQQQFVQDFGAESKIGPVLPSQGLGDSYKPFEI